MNEYIERLRNEKVDELATLFNKHDINTDIFGGTALTWATHMGNSEFVKRLIELGADVNKLDESGRVPLEIACYFGYEEIVQRLLNEGASINKRCFERARDSWNGSDQANIIDILKVAKTSQSRVMDSK
ncbi:ankyrin repeat domain-containing protein [Evansella tamaricis]|uniref:Ankyrin repeat domain-containing protein n=1 Tax=Evansella tamaricis TaxID=2069301 RepID=A0ABS6JB30_9BACI|nr:ankyrin repeat domain-containing protein [Evansella tamaricis]